MSDALVGNASTQSRGRRPLPPNAYFACTVDSRGAYEWVDFMFPDVAANGPQRRKLLTWVVGQWGGVFGAFPSEYAPTEVQRAVLCNETPGSYVHYEEYKLASLLAEIFRLYIFGGFDVGARFFQNGGDACAAAARIARAATGVDAIATQGYHGAHADFAHEPNWRGYPEANLRLHRRFEWGDYDAVSHLPPVAMLMVEVPAVDSEADISMFLYHCRRVCDERNIPLVFDDVVTGFRLALAGTAERYGVQPDMVTLGKAMSATGCISALVGRMDLMKMLGEDVFFSTTFGGSPGACRVANATIEWLTKNARDVYGSKVLINARPVGSGIEEECQFYPGHLHKIGTALKDGYNKLFAEFGKSWRVIGQPERSIFDFGGDEAAFSDFCSHMIAKNIIAHRPNFITLAHNIEHVEETIDAARSILLGQ